MLPAAVPRLRRQALRRRQQPTLAPRLSPPRPNCRASRAARLSPQCLIMHPGQINRGVEIDRDVADSSQSVILDQVTNGIAVRMAVLYLCAGGQPEYVSLTK